MPLPRQHSIPKPNAPLFCPFYSETVLDPMRQEIASLLPAEGILVYAAYPAALNVNSAGAMIASF